MTTVDAPVISARALARAAQTLRNNAESPVRAKHFTKAHEMLQAASWEFVHGILHVASASTPGGSYTVVGGQCHCEGWKHREQCWHADAWRVVNRAVQDLFDAADELWATPLLDPVAVAEAAFWQRYAVVLGCEQWSAVQEILHTRRNAPDTVDGWQRAARALDAALSAEAAQAAA